MWFWRRFTWLPTRHMKHNNFYWNNAYDRQSNSLALLLLNTIIRSSPLLVSQFSHRRTKRRITVLLASMTCSVSYYSSFSSINGFFSGVTSGIIMRKFRFYTVLRLSRTCYFLFILNRAGRGGPEYTQRKFMLLQFFDATVVCFEWEWIPTVCRQLAVCTAHLRTFGRTDRQMNDFGNCSSGYIMWPFFI